MLNKTVNPLMSTICKSSFCALTTCKCLNSKPRNCRIDSGQKHSHYNDVIMGEITSQITSLSTVYLPVYSGTENIKAPRHWPLCEEITGDRWIPHINGQQRGKCFHLMTTSWRICDTFQYKHFSSKHSDSHFDTMVVVRLTYLLDNNTLVKRRLHIKSAPGI